MSLRRLSALGLSLLIGCSHEGATPVATPADPVLTTVATNAPEGAPVTLAVSTDSSNSLVLADQSSELIVRVRVTGLALQTAARPPINLALVVDTSGSMEGPELEREREAVQTLVEHLRDGDALSIVTFGSRAELLVPATRLDATARTKVKAALRAMRASGTTDLAAGLQLGLVEAQKLRVADGINRVVLVGDGVPNDASPVPGLIAQAKQQALPITTLGLGADFDETLMAQVARDSGGSFHFVDTAARVSKVFDEELGRMQRVAANNTRVQVTPGPGVEIVEVIGQPQAVRSSRGVSFSLGALAEGQTRDTFVRVKVSPHKAGRTVELMDVVALYVPTSRQQEVVVTDFESVRSTSDAGALVESQNPEVGRESARARVADGIVQAIAMARGGNLAGARGLLDRTSRLAREEGKRLDDVALSDKAKEVLALKSTLASLAPAPQPTAPAQGGIPQAKPSAAPMQPEAAMAMRRTHGDAMETLQGL